MHVGHGIAHVGCFLRFDAHPLHAHQESFGIGFAALAEGRAILQDAILRRVERGPAPEPVS